MIPPTTAAHLHLVTHCGFLPLTEAGELIIVGDTTTGGREMPTKGEGHEHDIVAFADGAGTGMGGAVVMGDSSKFGLRITNIGL